MALLEAFFFLLFHVTKLAVVSRVDSLSMQVGSGCLDLCWVGCGRVDAVYAGVAGEGWHPWDYAAGWLFIEEAGGVVIQVSACAEVRKSA